ncbi:Sphingomyelin phosphodiesterase 2, neutral membrane (Neutral sphingomyelinase) [Trapelia coarctata]|nr:Sphingomyelin phosphodiesterase 2, neutral membrane (Neutral sphingomyelinase) [Trapelia coarctata]
MPNLSNPPEAINILTLNCWGLKYIAKLRTQRLDEIGRRIAAAIPTPDIVGLQECWCQADYQAIRLHTKSVLPYGKFYHSGIFGSGLVILSQWPIEESSAVERGHLVIGLGDFNMVPSSLAHRLIESYAGVKDVWRILHPDSSLGPADNEAEKLCGKPIPHAAYNLQENGVTCDSLLNTWRWTKKDQKRLLKGENATVDSHTADPNGKRLDYIFYHPSSTNEYRISSARVGMTQRHPSLGCSLSDHFSVEATLSRAAPHDEAAQGSFDVGISSTQLPATLSSSSRDVLQSLVSPILKLIQSYALRQRHQRRLFLSHFLLSLLISIACSTGIWWSPRGRSSFVIALISTLHLSAGVISGLIGGLFIGSELRALKEFEWEIQNVGGRRHPFNTGEKEQGEETALKDIFD